MWKYITKEQCKQFLLSLKLIDLDGFDDKKIINTLYILANNTKNNYKTYKIPKRDGTYRTIYEPSFLLKHIQRNILENVLNGLHVSSYAMAYRKGVTLVSNASLHVHKKMILKLDIKNFFDNICFLDIYHSCFSIGYFPKSIGMLLTYLCTCDEKLPQGAPTSSYISNLVMRDFDEEIGRYCEEKNITYTRYSDDMTFSGDFIVGDIIKVVRKKLYKLNLELNDKKICVISNNCKQKVTGLVVNDKVNVDISYRKKIRQEMYYIKKYGIESHYKFIDGFASIYAYLMNLYGRILYVLQINSNKEFFSYKKYFRNFP